MRIDDIVNLTDAELINRGFINEIDLFFDNLKDSKRGGAFFSDNADEINRAIKKGVYAIIYSTDIEVTDKEIAWIKVESLEEAKIALLKYRLLDKTLYITDEIGIEIIKSIVKDKRIAILDIIEAKYLNGDFIYVTSKFTNLSTNKKYLTKMAQLKIINKNFLKVDIVYDRRYSFVFPYIYLTTLQKVLFFLDKLELKYNLKSLKLDRFRVYFVNKKFEIVKFGMSDRVVIMGLKKDNYFMNELNFIFESLKYAKVKFYDSYNIKEIKKDDFNFAILIDEEISLSKKETEDRTLF